MPSATPDPGCRSARRIVCLRSILKQTDLTLARGKWMLLVEAEAMDGTKFRQRLELFVTDQVQG